MIQQFNQSQTRALFSLVYDELTFDRVFYGKDRRERLLTIVGGLMTHGAVIAPEYTIA